MFVLTKAENPIVTANVNQGQTMQKLSCYFRMVKFSSAHKLVSVGSIIKMLRKGVSIRILLT